MAKKLTAPQKTLMLKSMREGNASVDGARYRVAANLTGLGYGDMSGNVFKPTRAGLEALLYDRKLEDWRQGSMASMKYVEEVETALAEF